MSNLINFNKIRKFFLKIFKQINLINYKKNNFIEAEELRSDSDNGRYASVVINIIKNSKSFTNFKRNYAYREILEHVTKAEGEKYLNILKSRRDGMLEKALENILLSDNIGNPIKYYYPGISIALSPTTLRYVKVASDLNIMFGNELGNIAEIGCGYGGQALTNDQLLNVNHAKLFDLPYVNKLIQMYLSNYIVNGAYITTSINEEISSSYDLIISNYAFSELPKKLQLKYIEKVISQSRRGYLTMNSGLEGERSKGKLSLKELRKVLPDFMIFEEVPLTSPSNYIIAWGHDIDRTSQHFILKSLS